MYELVLTLRISRLTAFAIAAAIDGAGLIQIPRAYVAPDLAAGRRPPLKALVDYLREAHRRPSAAIPSGKDYQTREYLREAAVNAVLPACCSASVRSGPTEKYSRLDPMSVV
jgi:DNA-binding transcriptional LysR family regulator